MHTAMIFAAGRGERMRPLTDAMPKPLLAVGGKPLIVWQLEALARAGFQRIVINHAWLGDAIEAALGDGRRWGVQIVYSREGEQALETAGGIARALPWLMSSAAATVMTATGTGTIASDPNASLTTSSVGAPGTHDVFLAVSGDIFCDFDYTTLFSRAAAMRTLAQPSMHLVMVPNPSYHPSGDFALHGDRLQLDEGERLTFANIGLYDTRTFSSIAARSPVPRMALAPLFREAIARHRVTGERWDGQWANVGTPADLATLDALLRAKIPT